MHVEDLDISPSKVGETAQRIVDRALEELARVAREHDENIMTATIAAAYRMAQ